MRAITFWAALALIGVFHSGLTRAAVVVGAVPGSFDVSLSGSSSYSIPIKIAPGTAGTQPKIQLNYDSQTLGGPLGAGWSLGGFSAITRGPRDKFTDGIPAPVKLDDQDALFLDGQRLVQTKGPTGSGADRRIEYRKVNDDFTEVVQYGADLNHSYFRARTKGGVTLIFGNPGIVGPAPTNPKELDATIRFSDNSVIAYAESVAIDTAGNIIAFHYESDGYGDYNISEVDYTGHGSIDDNAVISKDRDPFASVSFVYEQASRPLEVYVGGQLVRKDKRLTDIYSCVSDSRFSTKLDCRSASASAEARVHQTAHYKIDYDSTNTSNRFVITQIHMYGADEQTEVAPTKFTYSTGNLGWDRNAIPLPNGLVLADTDKVARGYRFVHFAPDSTGTLDLLFSAQIGGKKVAYAFKNNGPASWVTGGQPWSPASKNASSSAAGTAPYDFEPPVPFVSEDGGDLGVILADFTGNGRTGIIKSNVLANQSSSAAYLAGPTSFEIHNEYQVPFVISRDGKVVASYRLANWSGGSGPDLIYESEGKNGFLKNGGPGVGWQPLGGYDPPIPLDDRTHLVDLECTGDKPALVGAVPDAAGVLTWKVFRFGSYGWQEETDQKFKPPFPASTNPEAIREMRFDGSASACRGLLVATAEGRGLRKAILPSADGWKEVASKKPIFDFVDSSGNASKAVVANLKSDGFDGIVANTLLPDGTRIAFAYSQDANGWSDMGAGFVPNAYIASDDSKTPVHSFVGPVVGQGRDDIAILNDQRVTAHDVDGTNRQFGKFFINDGTQFVEQASFAPPIPFAVQDKKDLGVRFIDLHGTGLPDVIYSRLVSKDGKTYLVSGAYRNTGKGWVPAGNQCTDANATFDTSNVNPPMKDGLCPPIPLAGADITGNPTQFVDLDDDGYVDMIYGYKDKKGNKVTKVYFNKDDGQGARKWVDGSSDTAAFGKFIPPDEVFLLASSGIGDMGVRYAKFDTNRVGALLGFRKKQKCFPHGGCRPGPSTLKAFVFNGTSWKERPEYAPKLPFVTQFDGSSDLSIDLFVQLVDIDGSGLPDLVANFSDPVTQRFTKNTTNKVWLNTGSGWASSSIKLPYRLDAIYWEAKTLVQIVDANGDGLPDLVMTNGGTPASSKTWLGNGKGWTEAPNWKIPPEAITGKDGDPGYRLVDTKGDGYLDVLWMRPDKNDGTPDRGLALNNGHDWSTRADEKVPKGLAFVDKDGVDQGVRLLSVTGRGLTDIIASFEGKLQEVDVNKARRADVLSSIEDGYGIKTTIAYETLLESDNAASVQSNPLGWRVYEREIPDSYPKVAPVPTTYVVRQATVDQRDSLRPVTVDYRYGKYQVDAAASRPLGFGWRESLNEFSNVLTRSEMVQDARTRPGVAVETSCIANAAKLESMVLLARTSRDPKDKFPGNLCPQGDQTASPWGYKISETNTCWKVVEGDLHGNVNSLVLPETAWCTLQGAGAVLSGTIIRQSAIAKITTASFEVDGQKISNSTDTFVFDEVGDILSRHGNVLATKSALTDGSSVETTNEYSDDTSHWILGRLTKTTVTKTGDLIAGSSSRKTETRCSSFEYDSLTGLLSAQQINCGHRKAVTTKFERDFFGNVVTELTLAYGEPTLGVKTEYDEFGRYEVASINALGHRTESVRDPTTGAVLASTDVNRLRTLLQYDSFGRLRRQTGPTGLATTTDLIDVHAPESLPKYDGIHDIAFGLSAPVNYAVRLQVGDLPPTWTLFDAKGRAVRQVTDGFTTDVAMSRYVFSESEYDPLGRVLRSSSPHDANDSSPKWSSNVYDALGRVCASTAINGLRTETLFLGRPEGGGIVKSVVNPTKQLVQEIAGSAEQRSCERRFSDFVYTVQERNPSSSSLKQKDQVTTATVNMRKQTIESTDALGKVTFEYDAGGRLEKMVGPTGAATLNSYDELGNKVAVADPDLGTWRYSFDPFGRVVRQVDAKGQYTLMEYDKLGRPLRRTLADLSTTWTYDSASHGIGMIAEMSNSNGYKEKFFYDEFERLVSSAVEIDNENFATNNEYDLYGRITKTTYPNSLQIQNTYDKKGFFTEVKNGADGQVYWRALDYDVLGRTTKEVYGNGAQTVRQYDASDERLRRIDVTSATGSRLMDLSLEYDLIGNLTKRAEKAAKKKESFEYDELNRLVAVVSASDGRSNFKYDAAGRITYKSGVGLYSYPGLDEVADGVYSKPFHAVLKTSRAHSLSSYKYDLNGNMVKAPGYVYEYSGDNLLKLIYCDANKWDRFDYGPGGDKFRQFSRIGNASEETLYVGMYERVVQYSSRLAIGHLDPTNFSGFERLITDRNYLANSSGTFAVIETNENYANNQLYNPGGDPAKSWFGKRAARKNLYFHSDQLGSIIKVSDEDGRVRDRFWYDPWGKRTATGNDKAARGFTGHEQLVDFGLVHMNGRVYNPTLAEFLSVDPLDEMRADTQSGNGYAYVRNNPLRYVDPSGYFRIPVVSDVIDAVGGAATAVWHGVTHFAGEVGKWFHENWRTIVVVAVVIVVTVVVTIATAGTATPAALTLGQAILIGAAAGAAGSATSTALYGGSFDEVLQSAIKGAVIGGISAAAFYGVGSAFSATEATSTSSQVGSMAAHGVVGGAKAAAEGGEFWKGFVATAATKASSLYGPSFNSMAGNAARGAVVGGTVSSLTGDKFANGAITGAFSATFNDYAHRLATTFATAGAVLTVGASLVADAATGGANILATPAEVAAGAAGGAALGYTLGRAIDDWGSVFATPPENAWDPFGPKAPGYPGDIPGYEDPKGGPNWVSNPNGPGNGWESKDGTVWVPTGPGGRAHGGPHWDVQKPGGGYENVYPPKK